MRRYNTDNLGPSTPAQFAFVNSIQAAYLQLIASLPAGTGVYSPTCLVHCLSGQASFSQFLVSVANGAPPSVSLNDALSAWYFGTTGLTSAISPCIGYAACTPACGVDALGIPCTMNLSSVQCDAVSLPTTWTASDANQRPPAPTSEEVEMPSEYSDDNVQPPSTDGLLLAYGVSGSVFATEPNLSSEQQAALSALVAKPAGAATSDSESSDNNAGPGDAALTSAGQKQPAAEPSSSSTDRQPSSV